MLAAGYPPSALGLVPPPPIVPTTIPDSLPSTRPPTLNLSSHPSKLTNLSLVSNNNQNSTAAILSQPTVVSTNPIMANELTTTSTTSVLQQRLSAPIEASRSKETSSLASGLKTSHNLSSAVNSSTSGDIGVVKDTTENRKEKKRNKTGTSNKGRTSGNKNHL